MGDVRWRSGEFSADCLIASMGNYDQWHFSLTPSIDVPAVSHTLYPRSMSRRN